MQALISPSTLPRFVAAVEAIYECAIAPEKWPDALEAIADVFDDIGANLSFQRDDGTWGVITSASLQPRVEEYVKNWAHREIRGIRIVERNCFIWKDVVTDADVVSEEEIYSHPYYTEFLASQGLRWFAAAFISPDPSLAVGVTIQRSSNKQPFSADECALFAQIGRHAERALRLSLRLLNSDVANTGLKKTLDRVGMAVYLADGLGRMLHANETASALLGSVFELVNGKILPKEMKFRARFECALTAALNSPSDVQPPLLFSIEPERLMAIYMLPMTVSDQSVGDQLALRVRVAILCVGSDHSAPHDPALVRDLLGLTLGEAKVAALVASGFPPRETSQKLGITEETARSVLKKVFEKTGVSRQTDLAVLLSRLAIRTNK